jgi:hypothetical protein
MGRNKQGEPSIRPSLHHIRPHDLDLQANLDAENPLISGNVTKGPHREFAMASGEMTDVEFLD